VKPSKFDFGDAHGERHLLLYGIKIDNFKSSKKNSFDTRRVAIESSPTWYHRGKMALNILENKRIVPIMRGCRCEPFVF
jgi:hypothetical protein